MGIYKNIFILVLTLSVFSTQAHAVLVSGGTNPEEKSPEAKKATATIQGKMRMNFKPKPVEPIAPPIAEEEVFEESTLGRTRDTHPQAVEPEEVSPVVRTVKSPVSPYTTARPAYILNPEKQSKGKMRYTLSRDSTSS